MFLLTLRHDRAVFLQAGEVVDKTSAELREEGNQRFRAGDLLEALALYAKALSAAEAKDDRLVILKNRAQCYLKLKRFKEAEAEAAEGEHAQGLLA